MGNSVDNYSVLRSARSYERWLRPERNIQGLLRMKGVPALGDPPGWIVS